MEGLVRLAIIGIGYWGPNLVRNFSRIPEASIEYLCDINTSSIESVAYLVPQAKKTGCIEEVLESDIDAVVVASPAVTHYEIALKALSSRKHVFVEKPIALKVSEAEELVRVAA